MKVNIFSSMKRSKNKNVRAAAALKNKVNKQTKGWLA